MSLILDALKRAERERQGEILPAPREAPMPVAGRAPPPQRVWLFAAASAIAAVALVGVALGGWKVWRERSEVPAPAVPEQAATPPVIVARPAPPEPAPAVVPGTEAVASLDDLSDEPTLEGPATPPSKPVLVVPAAKDPGPDVIATRPAPAPKVSRPAEIAPDTAQVAPPKPSPPKVIPPAPQPQPTPPQPAAQPPPEPEAQAAPPPEIPPALAQPAPLRKFREMPPDYRADFPALRIEIHVYEKAPQRRFVMINGRKYREGERLAEGPSLIEIVQDGIVLEYRGEKVLYTLGR